MASKEQFPRCHHVIIVHQCMSCKFQNNPLRSPLFPKLGKEDDSRPQKSKLNGSLNAQVYTALNLQHSL